jgi:hypothetical protein
MSEEGTVHKRDHGTLMIPKKPEIIMRLQSGKMIEAMASYNVESSMVQRNTRNHYYHFWHQVKL